MRSEKTARPGITTDPGNLMFIIYISLIFCALLIGTLVGGSSSKASAEQSLETMLLSETAITAHSNKINAEIIDYN